MDANAIRDVCFISRRNDPMSRREDEKWMRMCLALASKGAGHVSPNPLVGAVIVRNRRLIGKGYHQKFGSSHAEVNAIKNARTHHREPFRRHVVCQS